MEAFPPELLSNGKPGYNAGAVSITTLENLMCMPMLAEQSVDSKERFTV